MKKLKLFTLAIAALLTGNALAAPTIALPTETLTLPDINASADKWAGKVTTPYFIKGDTIVMSAYEGYQSISKQAWMSNTGGGSSSITDETKLWGALAPFCGAKAYGTTQKDNENDKYSYASTKTETERVYTYRVKNCTDALAYVATGSNQKRTVFIEAYEVAEGVVSSTAAATNNMESSTPGIIKISGLEATKEYVIVVYSNGTGTKGSSKGNSNFYEIAFVAAPMATDIATLKSITIDGEALENFDPATESYNVTLPYGTITVPTVAAVCTSSKANAVVTPAADVNSAATIVVTAEDGSTTKTYTINFSVAATQSSNAFLNDLTVDGKTISGFKKDSFNYNYQVAYKQDAYPVVAATVEDATATPVISQITSYPASATVVVTAQDGTTTQTYTINFTKATYPKVISSIVFSNGAKGAANESDATVKVPYLSTDAAAPTISEITVLADNEYIKADDESTITVSSKTDLTSLEYTVTKVALTPASIATNEEIAFDGTESYVFSTYGFDASKGWKFAKATEDESNRRVSDGRSRIYFALPAAKEVVLTSGTGGERGIKVYVNNVENTNVTATAANNESITIALNSNAANLVAIESNQTKGDGGFIKIKLVPVDGGNPDTSIDAINSNTTAVKRIVNGQLVIEKNGVLYNALGNVVK